MSSAYRLETDRQTTRQTTRPLATRSSPSLIQQVSDSLQSVLSTAACRHTLLCTALFAKASQSHLKYLPNLHNLTWKYEVRSTTKAAGRQFLPQIRPQVLPAGKKEGRVARVVDAAGAALSLLRSFLFSAPGRKPRRLVSCYCMCVVD